MTEANTEISFYDRIVDTVRLGASRHRLIRWIMLTVFFFALTVALQVRNGAYEGDYGAHPDEPSHYVNGLLVRDYVSTLSLTPPLEFAETYYLHYPKVGLGHWPPLFYIFEASWMLLFSVSRASMMLMLAFLTALLATTTAALAWRFLSPVAGILCGVVLVTLPTVQVLARQVSPGQLVGLLVLIASVAYARYLETERVVYAAGFGLFASAACLTKGTGLVLALLPLFSILLTRQYGLLRKASFWMPAAIVFVLSSPWYLLVPSALHGAAMPWEELLMRENLWNFALAPAMFVLRLGVILSFLVLVGLATCLSDCWFSKTRPEATWVVMVSLPLGFWTFQSVVGPAREPHNWIVVLGPCVLLAGFGLFRLAQGVFGSGPLRGWRAVLIPVPLLALSVSNVGAVGSLPQRPLREAAKLITEDERFRKSVVIVASDGTGEGVLVAQVAMREPRPGHFVLRSSKVLAHTDWFGRTYETRFSNPEELMDFLRRVPVGLLVVDEEKRLRPELASLLSRTLQEYSANWELVGEFPVAQPGTGAVYVYSHIGHERPNHPHIRLDMSNRLGKVLTNGAIE